MSDFDAIVIGSGITGGWAAKELTERGLKVLLVERGRMIEHQTDYVTETVPPWELPFRGYGDQALFEAEYPIQNKGKGITEWNYRHFVSDRAFPYETPEDKPFQWRRGYQLGGKSLTWGRQCFRWSDLDFTANAKDGHGTDWPIRYADLAPWYDHVENFVGVSGSPEGLPQLPDSRFQPPMAFNAVEEAFKSRMEARFPDRRLTIGRTANLTEEKPGRSRCQNRNICSRGCSYGAYFSTQSSTLPAARATGLLTLLTDSVVESIDYDPATRRATGVRVLNAQTGVRSRHGARLIFLCAGTINSVSVLLRSQSEAFPTGLGNSNDVLGRYFMDHALAVTLLARIKGFEGVGYTGNRPAPIIIPRYFNIDNSSTDILRGYSFQGMAYRRGWPRGGDRQGIGRVFKHDLRAPGEWTMMLAAFAEMLPVDSNRITLGKATDSQGIVQTHIDFAYGPNETKLLAHAQAEAKAMIGVMDAEIMSSSIEPGLGGSAVHEMGGARMGHDPATSILNGHNQMHGVQNLFITDGAAMASTACQNPSLTYMALTARAADFAVARLKQGAL